MTCKGLQHAASSIHKDRSVLKQCRSRTQAAGWPGIYRQHQRRHLRVQEQQQERGDGCKACCVRRSAWAAAAADHRLPAAKQLVDQYVQDNHVVGLNTGHLINAILEVLAQRLGAGELRGVRVICDSDVSTSEAAFCGVPITSLEQAGSLDVALLEADELCEADPQLAFIVGRYAEPLQPDLRRTAALAAAARHVCVLADGLDRAVKQLRGTLPVLVQGERWEEAGEELDDMALPDAEVWRRTTAGYDPTDPRASANPFIDDSGNHLLDLRYYGAMRLYGEEASYEAIAKEVAAVPGVVAHGLMVGVADAAAVVDASGVRTMERSDAVPSSA